MWREEKSTLDEVYSIKYSTYSYVRIILTFFFGFVIVTVILASKDAEFGIEIVTSYRTFHIRAPTETAFRYWHSGLLQVLESAREESGLLRNCKCSSIQKITGGEPIANLYFILSALSESLGGTSSGDEERLLSFDTTNSFFEERSSMIIGRRGTDIGGNEEFAEEIADPNPRRRIVVEILETEKLSNSSYKYLIENYKKPLLQNFPSNEQDVASIFSNIEEVNNTSLEMIALLESCFAEWADSKSVAAGLHECLPLFGELFQYVRSQSRALEGLKRYFFCCPYRYIESNYLKTFGAPE